MTEWLTTGQMIDQLKVGEIAKAEGIGFEVTMSPMGGIGPVGNPGDNTVLNGIVVGAKWLILPKYVSFEEAMKAFKEDKKVYCELDGKKDWFSAVLDWGNRETSPSFREMLKGKWTIEEE